MAKLDLSVGSPAFMAIEKLLDIGGQAFAAASPKKREEVADSVLDSWLFWHRVLKGIVERSADLFDGKPDLDGKPDGRTP